MGQCCRRDSAESLRREELADEQMWTRPMTASERRSTHSTRSMTDDVLADIASSQEEPAARRAAAAAELRQR